jgi:hypothetical protein
VEMVAQPCKFNTNNVDIAWHASYMSVILLKNKRKLIFFSFNSSDGSLTQDTKTK